MIERGIRYSVGSAAAVFVLALAAGAVPKPGPHQVAADRAFAVPADAAAAITKASETWIDAFERGDAETMAGFFTEDGLYAANTGQVLRGRDGIREGVRGWVDRRTKFLAAVGLPVDSGIDVEEQVLRFRTAGEAVYRLSRFMIRVEPSRCAMDAGHIISIWRKQPDGSWRIESALGNRDVEPPKEACGLSTGQPPSAELQDDSVGVAKVDAVAARRRNGVEVMVAEHPGALGEAAVLR